MPQVVFMPRLTTSAQPRKPRGGPLTVLLLLCLLLASSCDSSGGVPAGRIRVKNDFGGEEFSTIQVSAGGSNYTLHSRESILLPSGTTSIYFRYAGPKDTREYRVECPRIEKGITIKLIDVHANRMQGGCNTVWYQRG